MEFNLPNVETESRFKIRPETSSEISKEAVVEPVPEVRTQQPRPPVTSGMQRWELFSALALIVAGVAARFLPHPVNFTPVLGLGIFVGHLSRRNSFLAAFMLILLVVSDLALGFYEGISMVYLSYLLAFTFGAMIRRRAVSNVLLSGISTSVLFFIFSNLGVWIWSGIYENSLSGLFQCYIMALPFFPNTVFSTVATVALTFGLFSVTERLALARSSQA